MEFPQIPPVHAPSPTTTTTTSYYYFLLLQIRFASICNAMTSVTQSRIHTDIYSCPVANGNVEGKNQSGSRKSNHVTTSSSRRLPPRCCGRYHSDPQCISVRTFTPLGRWR